MNKKINQSKNHWVQGIPDHWEIKKIKYLFWERKEMNFPIKSNNLISLTIERGVIPHSEKTGAGNKPKEDISRYKLVHPGDIVLNSMNIIAGAVGISKYYGIVSPVYYMLILKNKNFSKDYFHYLFRTEPFQKSLYGLGNGILIKKSESSGKLNTIRMRIPMDKLGNEFIPVPPSDEQIKISDYLKKKTVQIELLIEKIKKKIEILKYHQKSLISNLLLNGCNKKIQLRDSGIEWIGKIPKHWKIKRISNLYSQVSIKGYENEENLSVFRDYGVVKRSDYKNKNVLSDDLSNYKLVNINDLVLNKMKTWMGSLGISKYRGIVSPAYYILKPKLKFSNTYIHELLRSKIYIDKYASLSKGVRPGQWDLDIYDFKSLKIPLPPNEEQSEISEKIFKIKSKYFELIKLENQRLEKNYEYLKTLIFKTVTGKNKFNN